MDSSIIAQISQNADEYFLPHCHVSNTGSPVTETFAFLARAGSNRLYNPGGQAICSSVWYCDWYHTPYHIAGGS